MNTWHNTCACRDADDKQAPPPSPRVPPAPAAAQASAAPASSLTSMPATAQRASNNAALASQAKPASAAPKTLGLCSDCGTVAEGDFDKGDLQFYCEKCWSAFETDTDKVWELCVHVYMVVTFVSS
jgi:hypothetical protein